MNVQSIISKYEQIFMIMELPYCTLFLLLECRGRTIRFSFRIQKLVQLSACGLDHRDLIQYITRNHKYNHFTLDISCRVGLQHVPA